MLIRVEIENGRKVNFKGLQQELGETIKIVQEAHTRTLETNEIEFFPTIVEIDAVTKTENQILSIIDAHRPEKTEHEQELEQRELPEWMYKRIRSLVLQIIEEDKRKK